MHRFFWFLGPILVLATACVVQGNNTDSASASSSDSSTTTGSEGNGGTSSDGAGGTSSNGGGSTAGTSSGGAGPSGTAGSGGETSSPQACTANGLALIDAINSYRMQNGLTAIPASSSMCIVSEAHVADLANNMPHTGNCNLHSWSNQGNWSACCYTSDHSQAQCMWDKPGELSAYPGYGYEIAAVGTNTPMAAVSAWQGSAGHNNVILNQDIWTNKPWGAVGAAIENSYAVVWFGSETDPMP